MLIINLKTEQRKGNYSLLSDKLLEEINLALQNKQKIILFHNRKGYARRIMCSDCRYLWVCPECGAPMILIASPHSHFIIATDGQMADLAEKRSQFLSCAYCRKNINLTQCPNCKSVKWKFLGYGLQKIKQELIDKTSAEIQIISSQKLLITFAKGESAYDGNYQLPKCDIQLSAQLLPIGFAGANHAIALAAILNADTNFYLPDFAAAVRVFNRITAFKKFCRLLAIPKIIIQTYAPRNEVIQTAARAQFELFHQNELQHRQKLNYPPFCQLVKLIYQNKDKNKCRIEAQKLYNKLKNASDKQVLSISPAQTTFIPKVRGIWRYQIVIKVQNSKFPPAPKLWRAGKVQNYNSNLKTILKSLPPSWLIDVDPVSLL